MKKKDSLHCFTDVVQLSVAVLFTWPAGKLLSDHQITIFFLSTYYTLTYSKQVQTQTHLPETPGSLCT